VDTAPVGDGLTPQLVGDASFPVLFVHAILYMDLEQQPSWNSVVQRHYHQIVIDMICRMTRQVVEMYVPKLAPSRVLNGGPNRGGPAGACCNIAYIKTVPFSKQYHQQAKAALRIEPLLQYRISWTLSEVWHPWRACVVEVLRKETRPEAFSCSVRQDTWHDRS
jgi:hypothetical protein